MKPDLKIITATHRPTVLAPRYPRSAINPDVPAAEWPFAETPKLPGDVVISLAPIETRRAKTVKLGLVRRMKAGLSSKKRPA